MGDYNWHIVKITRTYSRHHIFKYHIAENKSHKHGYPHKNTPSAGILIEHKQEAYGYPDKSSVAEGRYETHYIVHQWRGEIFSYKHKKTVFPSQKTPAFCTNQDILNIFYTYVRSSRALSDKSRMVYGR